MQILIELIYPRARESAFITNFKRMLTLVMGKIVKHIFEDSHSIPRPRLVTPIPGYMWGGF